MPLLSTRRTGLVPGPQGLPGPIGPPSPAQSTTPPAPNYGLFQNPILVTHAAPGTLTTINQLAIIETGTGTTALSLGAPAAGLVLACFDTDCSAAANNTTVTSATMFEDPNSGTLVTTATLVANGYGLGWYYDPNRGHYSLLWAYYPTTSGFSTPLVSSGGALSLTSFKPWGLFIAGDTVTFPTAPVPGQEFLATHDQIRSLTTISSGGVTFQRGGGANYTIQQPDGHRSGGVIETAASVKGFTDGANYRFAFDGQTPGVMRCISSLASP